MCVACEHLFLLTSSCLQHEKNIPVTLRLKWASHTSCCEDIYVERALINRHECVCVVSTCNKPKLCAIPLSDRLWWFYLYTTTKRTHTQIFSSVNLFHSNVFSRTADNNRNPQTHVLYIQICFHFFGGSLSAGFIVHLFRTKHANQIQKKNNIILNAFTHKGLIIQHVCVCVCVCYADVHANVGWFFVSPIHKTNWFKHPFRPINRIRFFFVLHVQVNHNFSHLYRQTTQKKPAPQNPPTIKLLTTHSRVAHRRRHSEPTNSGLCQLSKHTLPHLPKAPPSCTHRNAQSFQRPSAIGSS